MADQSEPTCDDTIQCFFFPVGCDSDSKSLENVCHEINSTVATLSTDYIWHRDEFIVYMPVVDNQKIGTPIHLISKTCFGDNIEDEWFIVHLIFEITKIYNNIIVQLWDNDGDFLLIEAADYLPKWANPETTKNRVFIYNNHIHIIPPVLVSLEQDLELSEALDIVKESSDQTQAPLEIENAILNRIGFYPAKATEHIHRAIVKLPPNIAALLTLKPKLIAPLVNAYCCHDELEAKICKNVKHENSVLVSVKFTKCLYAMLTHSKPIKTMKFPHSIQNDKQAILGLKLICAYKLITNKSTNIFQTKEFTKFLNSLRVNGYFQNNIEGSAEYQQLLMKAQNFFCNIECPVDITTSNEIAEILQNPKFLEIEKRLKTNFETELEEDSDDWLNIHPEQLNNLLNTRYGKQAKFKSDEPITPQTITNEISKFLKQTSDFEGIETRNSDQSQNIEFKSDEFADCLEKLLNILSTNDVEISDSDFSDDEQSETEIDRELKSKLHNVFSEANSGQGTIVSNMLQSMREEKASVGPSSNIMTAIGFNKTDLLDSDDD